MVLACEPWSWTRLSVSSAALFSVLGPGGLVVAAAGLRRVSRKRLSTARRVLYCEGFYNIYHYIRTKGTYRSCCTHIR